GARVDAADVPEAGDEQAALGGGDHRLDGLLAALHRERAAGAARLLAGALRPEAVVGEVLHDAALDPGVGLVRKAVAAEGAGGNARVERVGIPRHAPVYDLLADLVSAAGLGEEAAALVGVAGIERAADELDEVRGGRGFEHDGVAAGLDGRGVDRAPGLLDGAFGERAGIDAREVVVRR